jgi:nitrite reductase/ring-hydroxylating ferredoxin subunit
MDERELQEGQPRRVMVSGTNVFLLRSGGNIHALANRCAPTEAARCTREL